MKKFILFSLVGLILVGGLWFQSVNAVNAQEKPSPAFLAQTLSFLQDLLRQVQALQYQLTEILKKQKEQAPGVSSVPTPSVSSTASSYYTGTVVLEELPDQPVVSCILP